MAVIAKWRAADNDDTAWTNVNTDGGVLSYTGSPLKKTFDMTGRATTNFNVLGHYYTGGVAAAADYRYMCWAAVSSVATTDCVPFAFRTDDAITFAGSSRFYISEAAATTPDGAPAGTVVAGTYHKWEFKVNGDGTLDVYFDDGLVGSGEAGNSWHTRTIRMVSNVARIGGSTGNLKWQEAYVTDANGLTPPVVTTPAAAATGETTATGTWDDATCTATNADGVSCEISETSGSGFSEDGTENIGVETHDFTGLTAATTYYVRYRPFFTANGVKTYAAYTSEASFTTDSPPVTSVAGGSASMRNRYRHLKLLRKKKRD